MASGFQRKTYDDRKSYVPHPVRETGILNEPHPLRRSGLRALHDMWDKEWYAGSYDLYACRHDNCRVS